MFLAELIGGSKLSIKTIPCQAQGCLAAIHRWAKKVPSPSNKDVRVWDVASVPRYTGEGAFWNDTECAVLKFLVEGRTLTEAMITSLEANEIDMRKILAFAEAIIPKAPEVVEDVSKPQQLDASTDVLFQDREDAAAFEAVFSSAQDLDADIPF